MKDEIRFGSKSCSEAGFSGINALSGIKFDATIVRNHAPYIYKLIDTFYALDRVR